MNQFPKRGVFPVGQEPVPWIAPLPQSVRRRWRKQIPLQGNRIICSRRNRKPCLRKHPYGIVLCVQSRGENQSRGTLGAKRAAKIEYFRSWSAAKILINY